MPAVEARTSSPPVTRSSSASTKVSTRACQLDVAGGLADAVVAGLQLGRRVLRRLAQAVDAGGQVVAAT